MKSPAKYDTCFKSCYLTKNLLENYDELDSFDYWVLTDWIEETQPSKEQFHGGLGLFTQDGIKKPHYYAFDFMNKLGDLLIDKGNGYFITKSYGKIQILLYNYEHFNHLFASGETFDMTFIERYTPFSQLGKMEISLELTDIPVKACIIREHIINQASGSAFDEWVRMGAPNLCKKILSTLNKFLFPNYLSEKKRLKTIFYLSMFPSSALPRKTKRILYSVSVPHDSACERICSVNSSFNSFRFSSLKRSYNSPLSSIEQRMIPLSLVFLGIREASL